MEFGSFMEFHTRAQPSQAGAFEESFAHIDAAEELGLDGVWLAESHFSPERTVLSSPLIIAAAIAGRTKRMKVGTAVHLLPLTNPLRTAEEIATLDHVSLGRFEYGIGRSALPTSYTGYGISYAESRDRFFESLEILKCAWTQERFTYHGKFFDYDNVLLTPKPYQKPWPLIRVAATTADTFPRLGEMGLPIFIGLRQAALPEVSRQVESYKQAYADAGHEGEPNISLRVPVYVADSKGAALEDPEASFMRQFRRLGNQLSGSLGQEGTRSVEGRAEHSQELASVTWEQVQQDKVAVGTPEMVIDRVHELKERLSLSGLVAEFNAGEMLPREKIQRSLQLFCEKVAPAFR